MYGIQDLPLPYITCDDREAPLIAENLGFGFPTFEKTYGTNNTKIWNMVSHVIHGTKAWALSPYMPTSEMVKAPQLG